MPALDAIITSCPQSGDPKIEACLLLEALYCGEVDRPAADMDVTQCQTEAALRRPWTEASGPQGKGDWPLLDQAPQ